MRALMFDSGAARYIGCKALGGFWPGVFHSAISPLQLREVPEPALPSPEWVRLHTRLGGVCGTDISAVLLRNHPATFLRRLAGSPLGLGHENVAEIESVGASAGNWRVGQRVCVEPVLSCVTRGIQPLCRACRAGQISLCENITSGSIPPALMIGFNPFTHGSWGPLFVAHKSQLYSVPDAIPDEQAVLVDPVACALHAVLRRPPLDEERVLIIGGGFIGLTIAKCVRAIQRQPQTDVLVRSEVQGQRFAGEVTGQVLVHPRSEGRAALYDRIAARVGGKRISGYYGNQMLLGGYDVVYDCVGTSQSLTDAMKFTRARGTVMLVGTSGIGVIDTTPIWFSELQMLGTNGRQLESFLGRPEHTYNLVFSLIQQGRLDLRGLLSHQFELTDYKSWLKLLTGPSHQRPFKSAFVHKS